MLLPELDAAPLKRPAMKHLLLLVILLDSCTSCNAQQSFGTEYLKLEKVIKMPGVNGRIDHLTINLANKTIYVAALGNNTVEVVDLNKGTVIHSIKGLDELQGVCYMPAQNELVVANGGNGNFLFYNALTYAITALIDV